MDRIKKINFNKFTKRERILFYILFLIILESFLYLLIFNPILLEIKKSEIKISTLNKNIKLKKEMINKSKIIDKSNKELLKENKVSISKDILEDRFIEFKNLFPSSNYIDDENNFTINFQLEDKDLKQIYKFSKFYIFDNFYIKRKNEKEYDFTANIKYKNDNSILPRIVKNEESIDKTIDLNKKYFKERLSKENDKNIIEEKKVKKIEEKVREKDNSKKMLTKKIENEPFIQDKMTEKLNENKKILEENAKKDKLDIKKYEFKDLLVFTEDSASSNLFYPDEDENLLIYYNLKNKKNGDCLLILFNDVVDFKKLTFNLFIPQECKGEFGYYTTEKVSFKEQPLSGEINLVEIENIKNLRGLYYKIDSEQAEEGLISIFDFEGTI
ncbi:MAG: hypothetical protein ACTHWZ_01410 [Peptoniphilaceae bacterium]